MSFKRQSGFTLIEAVVATAVFAFIASSIIGVYIATLQIDRKSRAERDVTNNANYIMTFLAKEVRNGSITYSSYPNGIIPDSPDLYVENQANEAEHIFLSGQNLVLSKNSLSSNLNSGDVKVTNFKLIISPSQDPYQTSKVTNEQPHVTVLMELSSNYSAAGQINTAKIDVESTYTTRAYPSRE